MVNGYAAVFWLIAAVILFLIENATYQLVCIWFSIGALGAMAASFFGATLTVQLAIFLIVSIAVLIFVRPFVKDKVKFKRSATNADALIGKIGIVVQKIDNAAQSGRVTVNGLGWAARSQEDGAVIQEDSRVKILRIDGVKLIVEPVDWVEIQTERE